MIWSDRPNINNILDERGRLRLEAKDLERSGGNSPAFKLSYVMARRFAADRACHVAGGQVGPVSALWVLISLLLTVIATAVLLAETQTIGYLADTAAHPATTGGDLRALGSTLVHSVGGTVVLVVILALNVYKPRDMTRFGWRKRDEQRRALEP